MRLSEYGDAVLYGEDGIRLGIVMSVLFHPSEPVAVALMVRPAPYLHLFPLPARFVRLDATRPVKGGYVFAGTKLPGRGKAERLIGHDMDKTVIWMGMPVRDEDGTIVGRIAEATLAEDGSVQRLELTAGSLGDFAYGRIKVPGSAVRGFDAGAVVLLTAEEQLAKSGGLARKTGEQVAAVKARTDSAAKAVGQTMVAGSYAAGRVIGDVATTRAGKKARSVFKGLKQALRESLRDEDDSK